MKAKAKLFLSGDMNINLKHELDLMRRRSTAARELPDLLWRRLCSVVATSGSSINAHAFMALYDSKLRFDLLPKSSRARKAAIYAALEEAKVPRMREKKAQALADNYAIVKSLGGPDEATKIMLNLVGKQQKQSWIRSFHGVGRKYSNDIWMGIHDPDFEDAIALDTRVKNFAAALGFNVKSPTIETELLKFANDCGLKGWELDRLIYNFGGLILNVLKARGTS